MPVAQLQLTPSPRDNDVSIPLGELALEERSFSGSPSGDGTRIGVDSTSQTARHHHCVVCASTHVLLANKVTCQPPLGISCRAQHPSRSRAQAPLRAILLDGLSASSSGASSRQSETVDYSIAGARPNSEVSTESVVQGADTHPSYSFRSPPGPANALRPTGGSAETPDPPVTLESASVVTGAEGNGADAGAGAGVGEPHYSNSVNTKQLRMVSLTVSQSEQPEEFDLRQPGGSDVRMRAPQRHGHEVGPPTMARPPSPPVSLNPDSLRMYNEEHIYED